MQIQYVNIAIIDNKKKSIFKEKGEINKYF